MLLSGKKLSFIILIIVLVYLFAGCKVNSLNPVSPLFLDDFPNPDNWQSAYPNGGWPGQSSQAIEFQLTVKSLPSAQQMTIYAVKRPMITTDYILEIARRLNLKGEIIARQASQEILDAHDKMATSPRSEWPSLQPEALLYSQANLQGEVSYRETDKNSQGATIEKTLAFILRFGAIMYIVDKPQTQDISTENWPDNDEAKKIAYDFLNQAGQLAKNFGSFQQVKDDFVVEPYKVDNQVSYLNVQYQRRVAGYSPVLYDMLYEVHIDNDGEVIYMSSEWPVMDDAGSFEIIPAGEAFDILSQPRTGFITDYNQSPRRFWSVIPEGCTRIDIDEVSVGYIAFGWVLPVYQFKGKCFNASGNELPDEFTGWVEAVP